MSDQRAQPGQTLAEGRYHLLKKLGEGGMARVWCAWDERLHVHRALKLLLPAFASRSMIRQRFLNEARTMARLHHPHIVAVHDVVEDDAPYMVMELVRGGSLADHLERHGPLHPRQAAEATLAVLAALELAHDEGVIHRDIKPQNILVTEKGKPKVTDFGIARLTGPTDGAPALTRTGSTLGTWGFMAPEQRTSAKEVDARADLYAVGATLFALVTNEIPVDLFTAELDGARLEGLPAPLEPVIRRACRYHVHDRYDSAADMAAALREAMQAIEPPGDEVPALGGAIEVLPAPQGPGGGVSAETLLPELGGGHTFGLDPASEPPPALFDPVEADRSPTGLTRMELPEPAPRPSRAPRVVAALALLGLLVALAWGLPAAEAPETARVEAEVLPAQTEVPEAPPQGPTTEPPTADPPAAGSGVDQPPEPSERDASVDAAPAPGPQPGPQPGRRPPVKPAPAPEPEPEPEPAPEPAPEPPRDGLVRLLGDARRVVLVDVDGGRHGAGALRPGRYRVEADFGDGVLSPAGSVELKAGATLNLECKASFALCQAH